MRRGFHREVVLAYAERAKQRFIALESTCSVSALIIIFPQGVRWCASVFAITERIINTHIFEKIMQQQSQISLEALAHRLKLIEAALQARGIVVDNTLIKEDDEGELTDEFKKVLEERRKTPRSQYIPFDEVKKRLTKQK